MLNYRQAKTLKYGGSQNKLFDYLASGKPIISTVQMNYNLIDKYNCGITLEKCTPEHLAQAVMDLDEKSKEERLKMGKRGLECAEEFDYKVLTERFLHVIEKTLHGESKRHYKIYEGEQNNG